MQLSIVVPLFNEDESLKELHSWIKKVMDEHKFSYEIIFVDDGSKDNSWQVIEKLKAEFSEVRAIKFQRNYGKSAGLNRGFDAAEGDVIITRKGLEGSAVYALSPAIRKQIHNHNTAIIFIDLKPTTSEESLLRKMNSPRKKNSWSEHLIWQLKLSSVAFAILKRSMDKEDFNDLETLANRVKNIPLQITGMGEIDEAISTVGGISLEEINDNFELKKLPKHYVIGEMLDWDAPTGGYLLQGCFSMGKFLGDKI